MGQVKGTAVQSSLRYVGERFGEATLTGVLAALTAEDQRALGGSLLASSWYPMPAFLRFMREAQRQLGAQEPEVVRNMGRASCDHGVTGVYRVFFRLGSPEFIISRAARVFSSYYDTGELKVVESRGGRALVELTGLQDSAPEFCERIYGWMQRTLELSGARNLRPSHPSCVHRGDAACRFEGNWDY
jgi:uncharacterized protein (TIGR02265 family)